MSRLYALFGLSMEERAALLTLAEISRERGCMPVPDDALFVASWLGCSTRLWGKIRVSLLAKGKLEALVHYGQACLTLCSDLAPKLSEPVLAAIPSVSRDVFEPEPSVSQPAKTAVAEAKLNEINETTSAEEDPTQENDLPIRGSKKVKEVKKENIGRRIPDDWQPSEADLAYASKKGLTPPDADEEVVKFRDYWRNIPGAKARRLNWSLSWEGWVRNAVQYRPRNQARPHERPQQNSRDERHARAFAGAMDYLDELERRDRGSGGSGSSGPSGPGDGEGGYPRLAGPLSAVR